MNDSRRSGTNPALEQRKRNRRAFQRWLLDFDARVSWEKQLAVCRGYEIAEGGLSVICERPLPPETEIDLEYRLHPEADPVRVKAVLRHVQGTHFGLEFLNLGLKDRLAMVEYCEKLKTV